MLTLPQAVEDRRVRMISNHVEQAVLAAHLVPFGFEVELHTFGDVHLVFDDQNAAHPRSSPAARCAASR